jgi:molybdopterin/thiamine biosynthesis adenylyltransferase/rhodanese-related sulfurtransferase
MPSVLDNAPLSPAEIRRYARHLILPEIGSSGQKKLKQASVLLVGAGGLGAPAALYLAAAGIGRLGIVDFDVVDESNLHRQVLYGQSDVGKPKLQAAIRRLRDLNPFIEVVSHEEPLTSANALRILAEYDVILDGADNFPTRYLVNDACVLLGKPDVHGSVFRFEGQVTVFDTRVGPCYRCLYPQPPSPGLVPGCAEAGVLGVLPGVIGALQATEAIKLITGIGEPLIGRLLRYDALAMRVGEVKLHKDPRCAICGEQPTIRELVDMDGAASCGPPARPAASVPEISVRELKQRMDAGLEKDNVILLDVREPYEWQIIHLAGARLIPKNEVPYHLHELSQADEILVYCRSGVRSAEVVRFLLQDVGLAQREECERWHTGLGARGGSAHAGVLGAPERDCLERAEMAIIHRPYRDAHAQCDHRHAGVFERTLPGWPLHKQRLNGLEVSPIDWHNLRY